MIEPITTNERVYRYVWTGGERYDPQPLTVVRVNRKTITVRTDQGSTFRINPDELYRMPKGEVI